MTHASCHEAVFFGHIVFKQHRAHGGGKPGGLGEVFDGNGQAVHPAFGLTQTQGLVRRFGLAQEFIGVSQAHNGIELGVQARNVPKKGGHHLLARELLVVNAMREVNRRAFIKRNRCRVLHALEYFFGVQLLLLSEPAFNQVHPKRAAKGQELIVEVVTWVV